MSSRDQSLHVRRKTLMKDQPSEDGKLKCVRKKKNGCVNVRAKFPLLRPFTICKHEIILMKTSEIQESTHATLIACARYHSTSWNRPEDVYEKPETEYAGISDKRWAGDRRR